MPNEETPRDREIAAIDDAIRQTTAALTLQQTIVVHLKRAIEVEKEKTALELKLAKCEKKIKELKAQIDNLKRMGDDDGSEH